MRNRKNVLPLALAAGLLSALACALPTSLVGSEVITAVPVPAQITPPGPTAPTLAPTAAPAPPAQPLFVPWACEPSDSGGPQGWCLFGAGEPRSYSPDPNWIFLDYAPATNRVLYGGKFPDHGAGSGNLAVYDDVYAVELDSFTSTPIFQSDSIVAAQWAPDGQSIAYIRATATTQELRWRAASGEDRLLASDVVYMLSISPSGDRVAFDRETGYNLPAAPGVFVVDVATSQEIKISDADRGGSGGAEDQIVWSWDESNIVVPVQPQLVRAATDGSASVVLTIDEGLSQETWPSGMFSKILWHPDGQHLVATVIAGGPLGEDDAYLLVMELDPTLERIVSGTVITNDGLLLGWDAPGQSVWVRPYDVPQPPVSLPLP